MAKNPTEQTIKRRKRSETASVVAGISGKSIRLVQMVIEGQRENDSILEACIMYEQGKSKLIQSIKEIVPFN